MLTVFLLGYSTYFHFARVIFQLMLLVVHDWYYLISNFKKCLIPYTNSTIKGTFGYNNILWLANLVYHIWHNSLDYYVLSPRLIYHYQLLLYLKLFVRLIIWFTFWSFNTECPVFIYNAPAELGCRRETPAASTASHTSECYCTPHLQSSQVNH